MLSIIISGILYYGSKIINFQKLYKDFSIFNIIRIVLVISILITFFINCFSFWLFSKCYFSNLNLFFFSNDFYYKAGFFFFRLPLITFLSFRTSVEFFGFIFIILAYIVGLISLLALDTRLYYNNIKFIFTCNVLVIFIHLFTIINDLLLLFIFYECMMIPSFLFVYFVSPYRRGIQASLYFLI
jgi:hypothetical protein